MTRFDNGLEFSLLVMYEEKIYDVIYDDIRTKRTKNYIDAYLSPLIEVLKLLWDKRVETFVVYQKVNFNLFVLLFCTIDDFQHGNLSSYDVIMLG